MQDVDARRLVLTALRAVAPDLEAVDIEDHLDFRRDYDLDSADYLAFIVKIHDAIGRDIPEADYPRLATLAQAAAYVGTCSNMPAITPFR